MENFIYKYLPPLSSAGPWLSWKGALYSGLLGILIATVLINLNCIPVAPTEPKTTALPIWNFIYIIGFPILFIVAWLIWTQIYLRTGSGTKIGLAYDGHKVDIADWKRTRNTLHDLLQDGKVKNKVSLRFVPFRYCRGDKRPKKYMERYKFAILTTVQESYDPNKTKTEGDQNPFFPNINIRIASEAEGRPFFETIVRNSLQIIQKRTKDPTLANVLDARAENLHDMLLLFIATYCFLQKKYKDSSAILQHLDQRLSKIMDANQNPRLQIRQLAAESFLQPSSFPITEIPNYPECENRRKFAEKAMCYFDEFPRVATVISRIRFLVGDEKGAIELTKKYRQKIEEVKQTGDKPPDKVLVNYYLNSGFLSFIQGHWVNAYNDYCEMLSIDAYRNENWNEIIAFIDYVAELECYEGIFYLQTLYRRIANKRIENKLRKSAREWVNQDDSRKELKKLLSRYYPSLKGKTKKKVQGRKQKNKKRIKKRRKRIKKKK